jgi:two-component sensor histidine kinase
MIEPGVLGRPPVAGDGAAVVEARPDAETEIELRMLELRHRIKNILGVVQSLVNQTLRDGVTIAEARVTLGNRLVAVSHAVDLLLSGAWEAAALDQILKSAMTLGTERIEAEGPELQVGPSAAMMLSILFHELECNALKYGALSSDQGAVTVRWAMEGEALVLTWSECGGPAVAPASEQGFGTKLISRIAARFGGESVPVFHPRGVSWRVSLPLASLRD